MELWLSDLAVWQRFISERPTGLVLVKALTELGWYGLAHLYLLPWHEEDRLIFPNGCERRAADQKASRPPDRQGQSSSFVQTATYSGVTSYLAGWSGR
jgi:hypothetical protein